MKPLIYVLLSLFLSQTALAIDGRDLLEKIKQDNPDATPFEILKELYNASTVRAVPMDFDPLEEPTSQDCSIVKDTHPDDINNTAFYRFRLNGGPWRVGQAYCAGRCTPESAEVFNPYWAYSETPSDIIIRLPRNTAGEVNLFVPGAGGDGHAPALTEGVFADL